jgi:hypothetical protein
MGATVFRIRIELIFGRCGNLITPSRSCRGLAAQCRAYRVPQAADSLARIVRPTTARRFRTHQRASEAAEGGYLKGSAPQCNHGLTDRAHAVRDLTVCVLESRR